MIKAYQRVTGANVKKLPIAEAKQFQQQYIDIHIYMIIYILDYNPKYKINIHKSILI